MKDYGVNSYNVPHMKKHNLHMNGDFLVSLQYDRNIVEEAAHLLQNESNVD